MSYNLFKRNKLLIKRFISKEGRLISQILELSDILKIEDLLVTLKAFVSIDHVFLRNTLEKFGFWKKNQKDKC